MEMDKKSFGDRLFAIIDELADNTFDYKRSSIMNLLIN